MSATAQDIDAGPIPGWFWLPGSDTKVAGQLMLSPNRIELRLVGAVTPLFVTSSVDGTDNKVVTRVLNNFSINPAKFVVHGRLMQSPGKVTLVDCITIDQPISGYDDLAEEQHILATYMFGGDHLSGPDEEFAGMRVRLRNLETWASVSDVDASFDTEGHGMTVCCHLQTFTPIPLESGSTINIYSEVSAPHSNTFYGRSLKHKVMFDVANISNLTWRELERQLVTPLISLLTMCTGDYCRPTEYHALTQDNIWVSVVNGSTESEQSIHPLHKMLLPLSSLTLARVAAWLNLVEKLGPLPPVIAKALTASSISVETDLLNLTTVAEGLHNCIAPYKKRLKKEDAVRLRTLVKEALKDEIEGHKKAIRDAIGHITELSYRERLLDLIRIAADGMPNVVGNAEQWAKTVRDCRNDYAHRTAGFLEKKDIDKYVGVILSLRWILAGVLLLQTGIAPEVLAARLAQDSAYQFFLVQIRDLLPNAYPADEPDSGTKPASQG